MVMWSSHDLRGTGPTDLVGEVPQLHVLCKDVQHPHHLREDENPVPPLFETNKQLVRQIELATATDQSLYENIKRERECSTEHKYIHVQVQSSKFKRSHLVVYRYMWYANTLLLPVACLWTVSHSRLVLGQSTCGCNTSLAPWQCWWSQLHCPSLPCSVPCSS